MRRMITRPLFGVLMGIWVFIFSACTLPLAAGQTIPITQTFAALTQNADSPLLFTPTLFISETPSPTITVTPTEPPITSTPTISPRPLYYTLQPGEFPYCIARRFDVDPKELLALNNLPSGTIYAPGLVLSIPQSGRPFPDIRALIPHPTTYVVPEAQMSVFKIACKFGDVDPLAIVQRNNLLSYTLDFGMTIEIP
ncbi:MAG: LysM peptidoglycan-binding domain-containing protein [Anaerolineaceae bacterium]|nr:MAG: LysM peptidoglycan-binding domain-containing protein [Anaerolineaceae bacterium]